MEEITKPSLFHVVFSCVCSTGLPDGPFLTCAQRMAGAVARADFLQPGCSSDTELPVSYVFVPCIMEACRLSLRFQELFSQVHQSSVLSAGSQSWVILSLVTVTLKPDRLGISRCVAAQAKAWVSPFCILF